MVATFLLLAIPVCVAGTEQVVLDVVSKQTGQAFPGVVVTLVQGEARTELISNSAGRAIFSLVHDQPARLELRMRGVKTATVDNVTPGTLVVELEDYQRGSIFRLIANPEQFAGAPVEVAGYFGGEFEAVGLFATAEDLRFLVASNALRIEQPRISFDSVKQGELIHLSGVFRIFKGDDWAGELEGAEYINENSLWRELNQVELAPE